MQANYETSLKRVLAHEGGYTDDPRDPGGATNWGITIFDARMYWKRDATAEDVKAMPLDVAKRIYKSKYWDAMRCDELPAGVDYAVFDFGVNSGISRSLKFLEGIASVPVDGKADDTLIRTVANMPAKPVITELCNKRLVFLQGLKTWPVFGNGWGRRVAEVKDAAIVMASNSATPASMPKPAKTPKTEKPTTATKPIIQSKTFWAQIIAVLTALGGALTDWRALAVIGVAALAAYVIYERSKRSDISGVLK
jgi:lysozyme family protein